MFGKNPKVGFRPKDAEERTAPPQVRRLRRATNCERTRLTRVIPKAIQTMANRRKSSGFMTSLRRVNRNHVYTDLTERLSPL